jgi:chromate reductase, NAD(P)H dehydrogenase (quinone)
VLNLSDKIKILGFAGSLRKGSYNRAVLKSAMGLVPQNAELEVFDIDGIPVFNQDIEKPLPSRVQEFKEKIRAADAILIATPEYNHSISGVLKNAMDWASRPYGDNSFEGKPVAIMSASDGMLGGERAQWPLRQVFVYLDMHPINKPEVIIPNVSKKIDSNGILTDEETKEHIKKLLDALAKWALKLKAKN